MLSTALDRVIRDATLAVISLIGLGFRVRSAGSHLVKP